MAGEGASGFVRIDGSMGEGGGQVLRSSLALSMCTGTPFEIHNIRARRPKPGLMRQHLTCVEAAQAVCTASVSEAQLGSTTLRFEPGTVRAGEYNFAVGSAGSCMLVLQTVMPALMLAKAGGPSRVRLSGGTHNSMSPPFHFVSRTLTPLLRRLGALVTMDLVRHGFYPRGGGVVEVTISPAVGGLQPFDLLETGKLLGKYSECLSPGVPATVAEEEVKVFTERVGWSEKEVTRVSVPANEGPGNVLMATLEYEHVTEVLTSFGERRRPAAEVAHDLAGQVSAYVSSSAPVGEHLCDQLMVPIALAVVESGRSATWRASAMSQHSWTNLDTVKRFLRVTADAASDDSGWLVTLSPDP